MSEDKKDENLISSNENEENTEKVDNQLGVDENSNNPPSDISNENQNVSENQENQTKTDNESQNETTEHQVIHKKDGRLHIYVRQDKYKGELKSKNWVGRLYIDGKQKISSSGTQNLDEAIPILEKWFDDIHAESEKQKKLAEEAQQTQQSPNTQPTAETTIEEKTTPTAVPTSTSEVSQQEIDKVEESAAIKEVSLAKDTLGTSGEESQDSEKGKVSNILGKFKNLKFKKPSLSSLKGIKLPKSPVKSKDIENICKNVFNLANPDTGKFT